MTMKLMKAAALAPLAAAAGLLVAVAPAGPAGASTGCVTAGKVTTCTFTFTGGAQTWTVPAGVHSASFTLYGAAGGTAVGGTINSIPVPGAVPPSAPYSVKVAEWTPAGTAQVWAPPVKANVQVVSLPTVTQPFEALAGPAGATATIRPAAAASGASAAAFISFMVMVRSHLCVGGPRAGPPWAQL